METTTAPNRVYEIITERLLKALEGGKVPWRQTWVAMGQALSLATKKPYRGINQIVLGLSSYQSLYWATYKQITALGGQVRKGEKSTPVVFWKWLKFEKTDKESGEKSTKKVPLLRYFNVFNVDQCDGLEGKVPVTATLASHERITAAETIVADYLKNGPKLNHGGDRAFYVPALDSVQMPNLGQFKTSEEYYSTLFHELTHSTGHKSRINRFEKTGQPACFGDPEYSKEELIAEFGAAFLSGMVGIENVTVENSGAYIQHWMGVLKADSKVAVQAAANAQKAVDLILGTKFENNESEES